MNKIFEKPLDSKFFHTFSTSTLSKTRLSCIASYASYLFRMPFCMYKEHCNTVFVCIFTFQYMYIQQQQNKFSFMHNFLQRQVAIAPVFYQRTIFYNASDAGTRRPFFMAIVIDGKLSAQCKRFENDEVVTQTACFSVSLLLRRYMLYS